MRPTGLNGAALMDLVGRIRDNELPLCFPAWVTLSRLVPLLQSCFVTTLRHKRCCSLMRAVTSAPWTMLKFSTQDIDQGWKHSEWHQLMEIRDKMDDSIRNDSVSLLEYNSVAALSRKYWTRARDCSRGSTLKINSGPHSTACANACFQDLTYTLLWLLHHQTRSRWYKSPVSIDSK